MEKAKFIMRDILKSAAIGAVINLVLGILIFVISLMVKNWEFLDAALILRSAFLFLSGFLLLIFAGVFIKDIFGKPFDEMNRWRDYFKALTFEHVFFIIILTFIFTANIIDSIIRMSIY